LRALREGSGLKQDQLAAALGIKAPSISSWESPTSGVVPPESRLAGYAVVFCRDDPMAGVSGGVTDARLTEGEEQRRRRLVDELGALREAALAETSGEVPRAEAIGRFWHFPDGRQVRIIGAAMFSDELPKMTYANPFHPNYIQSLTFADLDATIELFGHVRALNPESDVRFLRHTDVTSDDLTGHVVILGPAVEAKRAPTPATAFYWFVRRVELPIAARPAPGGDPEYDSEFVVTTDDDGEPVYAGAREEVYRPLFLRTPGASSTRTHYEGVPLLEYDVALLARQPNPMNLSATVTFCTGLFSRGSYGAVRALTDANLREANERWLSERVDLGDFWLLMHVPVFLGPAGAETVTPDVSRPFHRLRRSG
jgi:transcriptional regulator with XRE-family HTH domain